MRKRILAGLLTVALALSLLPVSALASTTTFSPGQTCTRAQIVTFLWRDMALALRTHSLLRPSDFHEKF